MDIDFPRFPLPADTSGAPGERHQRALGRIALIGNFLPRRCGIATFTTDTWTALRKRFPETAVDVWAMRDFGQHYDFPDAVTGVIDADDPRSYAEAAKEITARAPDLVWLQHEFGIFGGPAGGHILKLLDRLTVPLAVTLHTVLEQPLPEQRRVTEAILARAAVVIVMADGARRILIETYGADPRRIQVIPHGIPDRPFVPSADFKPRFGLEGREVILSFGLISPGKGLETMIAALPAIVAEVPDTLYVILGATHPNLIAREGEAYRERLKRLAEERGVADHVRWVDSFVETGELLDWLAAADIYVTPYLNPAQITSGTLAYAIGLGKPVVSTPYAHAAEILPDGTGRLVPFGDSAGFASAIVGLLTDPVTLESVRHRAYALGRTMIWPRLAEAAMAAFERVVAPPASAATAMPPVPANVSFAAVERLSDSTGILQHSRYGIPDRRHGYCLDDNARALILMCCNTELPDAVVRRWAPVYAAFVDHAWNRDRGTFRNFMSFERSWLEEQGSDDSFGRAIWALGVTAGEARDPLMRHWAAELLTETLPYAATLAPPRSKAFTILGMAAAMAELPDAREGRALVERFGDDLHGLVDQACRPDWAWFEIVLAYDNCRLPEALLRAGRVLDRADLVDRGLHTLEWIVKRQTSAGGRFRPVGSDSFGRAYAKPLPFDQQPLEAAATIDACSLAFEMTGDAQWRKAAESAHAWFLGSNDLGLSIADAASGECADGLTPLGLNLNAGAESVLAFHLATAAMRKLQRAKPAREKLHLAVA